MTRVVILQSNYIPWRGYFDLINEADIFIFYDEVQFTCQDWRNRNIIVTPQGEQWLSIPVKSAGKFKQPIIDTQIASPHWIKKHWGSLQCAYGKSPGFTQWRGLIEKIYDGLNRENSLALINRKFITEICQALSIETQFRCSTEIKSEYGKTERLIGLCQAVGGTEYISGPAARDYIDESLFEKSGIKLSWKDYPTYKPYTQNDENYRPGVTILDTLFRAPDIHPLTVI